MHQHIAHFVAGCAVTMNGLADYFNIVQVGPLDRTTSVGTFLDYTAYALSCNILKILLQFAQD